MKVQAHQRALLRNVNGQPVAAQLPPQSLVKACPQRVGLAAVRDKWQGKEIPINRIDSRKKEDSVQVSPTNISQHAMASLHPRHAKTARFEQGFSLRMALSIGHKELGAVHQVRVKLGV